MSVFTLLRFLAYFILFIIAIIFLVTLFPLNVYFLSNTDGLYYDATVDFGVLLNMLYGSVGFGPEGGSFKLWLFSLPVYSTRLVDEEPDEKPKETKPKRRRNTLILFEPLKRLTDSVTRIIKVKKLDVSVTAGLSDPYISGMIFGIAYPVAEMTGIYFPPLSISLTPVFVEETFRTKIDGSTSMRIILFVVPLLRFVLSKEYREYRRS